MSTTKNSADELKTRRILMFDLKNAPKSVYNELNGHLAALGFIHIQQSGWITQKEITFHKLLQMITDIGKRMPQLKEYVNLDNQIVCASITAPYTMADCIERGALHPYTEEEKKTKVAQDKANGAYKNKAIIKTKIM